MTRRSDDGERWIRKASPIPNPVRSLSSKISSRGDLGFLFILSSKGCLYYEIGICNLHHNSILLVSTFIHLYESFGGFALHFDLFRYIFCLRKKGLKGDLRSPAECT
jgi:hypothetical protein